MSTEAFDVVVVGAGNAAMCAAHAAREKGCSVLVLERASEEERGGNSTFTAGNIRTVYNNVDDLKDLIPDLTEEEIKITDFGTYTEENFFDDLARVTQNRCDPDLVEVLVKNIAPTMKWLQQKGVRFQPIWGAQAYKINGRFKFWGGLTVCSYGGGPGLVEAHHKIAAKNGIAIKYNAMVTALIADDDGVHGVKYKENGKTKEVSAKAVVLASGGFQANVEWRTRYLGPNWDLAKVRGTRFNTGMGHEMAFAVGAQATGHWSGCHAVGWERNAPPTGDLAVGDNFQKHSYPWGVMINARGKRFVDEGADFRNYTYAKYGRVILEQPEQFAWQVFDKKIIPMLRAEYRIKQVTKVTANTLEELAEKLEGVDPKGFLEEIKAYNAAVMKDVPFDPNIKDGRGTTGLAVNKTNWANTIDEAPFEAYATTCGITFTFGGLKINTEGHVLDTEDKPIPGLYAAGELVGGIFYFNYPGGSGLAAGMVFGKVAGTSAAKLAKG